MVEAENQQPALSVVIPMYNEEDNVAPMCERLLSSLSPLGLSYEIVLVDDGSKDKTLDNLRAQTAMHPQIRVVKLRRNYGQTPAMAAGIEVARGKTIVLMDGDLQNDPADIPRFLEKMEEGYDIVVGWRQRRQDYVIRRKIPSWIANRLLTKITGVKVKDTGCSLKSFRAELIKGLPLYSEMHRFIPVVASMAGARMAQIPVTHHARQFGQSKYGLSRIYKVAIDLIVLRTLLSLAGRPFAALGWGAAFAALLGIGGFIYAVTIASSDAGVSTITFAGLGVLLAALAIFLFFLGLLVELLYGSEDQRLEDLASLTIRQYDRPDRT
ncbi:MAG: glycosyltransferase family 2 protein [Rhodospirillales bacterium]|nr:glycosyltransferase family 2 protein [Rhodospirillales bacterium]